MKGIMHEGPCTSRWRAMLRQNWKAGLIPSCLIAGLLYLWTARTPMPMRQYCEAKLNTGRWIPDVDVECGEASESIATCGHSAVGHWQWQHIAKQCCYHRLDQRHLRTSLGRKWLVFIGDSIARNVYASLLRHVADPRDHQAVVKAHSDFEYTLPNDIKASFFWAPYVENVTDIMAGWQESPATVVISIGLWHMLHVHESQDFLVGLQSLKPSLTDLLDSAKVSDSKGKTKNLPSLHSIGVTAVAQEKLKAEDKRQHMTKSDVKLYNQALGSSGLLQPQGPLHLIDMHAITEGCGPACTEDGVHFNNVTYDAAFQIWANSMLLQDLM